VVLMLGITRHCIPLISPFGGSVMHNCLSSLGSTMSDAADQDAIT
jgi:hypothetical protein